MEDRTTGRCWLGNLQSVATVNHVGVEISLLVASRNYSKGPGISFDGVDSDYVITPTGASSELSPMSCQR